MPETVYDFTATSLAGETLSLARYRGEVLLIVNTASECGFTPQYQGLQRLHERYAEHGLRVLGFPCNQFGGQEPGSAEQIAQFCQRNYGVDFALFAKIDVNGRHTHPLFAHLKKAAPGRLGSQAIKWNFTKFLVNRRGQVIKRFASTTEPRALVEQIEALLAEDALQAA